MQVPFVLANDLLLQHFFYLSSSQSSAKLDISINCNYLPLFLTLDTPTAINKSSREKESHKRKTASGESDNDPIPQRVVKEISELLQITSATDESAKIAEEVKNRKKSKKG